jgi:hypothetical protein
MAEAPLIPLDGMSAEAAFEAGWDAGAKRGRTLLAANITLKGRAETAEARAAELEAREEFHADPMDPGSWAHTVLILEGHVGDLCAAGDTLQSAASRLSEFVQKQQDVPYEVTMAAIEARDAARDWTDARVKTDEGRRRCRLTP